MNKVINPMPMTGTSRDGRLMHYSVGAIIEDHGRFLLMDRMFEPYGWASMAGHVDEGEDFLTALMREGREELGTNLISMQFLREQELSWNYCRSADVHYWQLYRAMVDRLQVAVNPHEAKSWGWFSREEMAKMPLEPVWKHWFTLEGIL